MAYKLTRRFNNCKFSSSCLREVRKELKKHLGITRRLKFFYGIIDHGNYCYNYVDKRKGESEFFDKYREKVDNAHFYWGKGLFDELLKFDYFRDEYDGIEFSCTSIEIKLPDTNDIHDLFAIFERYEEDAKESFPENEKPPEPPTIFIGHGRSKLWQELHNHLRDKHGYIVKAYETGARAGHAVRNIVEDMAKKSNIAFLVHTAEDEMQDGSFQARPNVIHETGLFQGKLGFSRAIVLLEKGCKSFSNLDGIEQIRFSKGKIRETFGDVIATLRREFEDE